ncbi:MAG: hypothetical protein KDE47_30285, partial [Caldilineaceae bacterium]|nr:hypothetical protein [Caldilineaceae bacterium]
THKGAESLLTGKMRTGSPGNRTEAEHKAFQALDEEIEPGITWDSVTTDKNTAQQQIASMLASHLIHIAPQVKPIALEQRFYLEIEDGFCLSGTLDVLEIDTLRDLKTGKLQRQNLFQYGAYKLLAEYNGHPISAIKEDYIPRTMVPTPETIDISTHNAECETRRLLKHIPKAIQEFREDPDKDPGAFNANPHSMLCSETFCPAWGTAWCSAWKPS